MLSGIGNAQIPLSAGVGRPQYPTVFMDDFREKLHRQAPQLQDLELHVLRHDHQDVAGVNGVVLHTLKHQKVLLSAVCAPLPPTAVSFIGIMIRDQHSVKALFFQDTDKFLYGHLTV